MRLILVRYNSGLYNYLDFFHFDGTDLTLERSVNTSINVYGIGLYQGRIAITDGTKLQLLNKDGSLAVTKNWTGLAGLYGFAIRGNRLQSAVYDAPYWITASLTDDFYYTPGNVTLAKGGNGLAANLNQYFGSRQSSHYLVYNIEENQNRVGLRDDSPYGYLGIDFHNGQIIGEDVYTENLMAFSPNINQQDTFTLKTSIGTFGSVKVIG